MDTKANLPFAIDQGCKMVIQQLTWGAVSSPVHREHSACMTNRIFAVIPPYLKLDDPGNQSSY